MLVHISMAIINVLVASDKHKHEDLSTKTSVLLCDHIYRGGFLRTMLSYRKCSARAAPIDRQAVSLFDHDRPISLRYQIS